jgi:hypothetical protein
MVIGGAGTKEEEVPTDANVETFKGSRGSG